jgi:hypothetical protein
MSVSPGLPNFQTSYLELPQAEWQWPTNAIGDSTPKYRPLSPLALPALASASQGSPGLEFSNPLLSHTWSAGSLQESAFSPMNEYQQNLAPSGLPLPLSDPANFNLPLSVESSPFTPSTEQSTVQVPSPAPTTPQESQAPHSPIIQAKKRKNFPRAEDTAPVAASAKRQKKIDALSNTKQQKSQQSRMKHIETDRLRRVFEKQSQQTHKEELNRYDQLFEDIDLAYQQSSQVGFIPVAKEAEVVPLSDRVIPILRQAQRNKVRAVFEDLVQRSFLDRQRIQQLEQQVANLQR